MALSCGRWASLSCRITSATAIAIAKHFRPKLLAIIEFALDRHDPRNRQDVAPPGGEGLGKRSFARGCKPQIIWVENCFSGRCRRQRVSLWWT
jgi:hypothetical protein